MNNIFTDAEVDAFIDAAGKDVNPDWSFEFNGSHHHEGMRIVAHYALGKIMYSVIGETHFLIGAHLYETSESDTGYAIEDKGVVDLDKFMRRLFLTK